MDDEVKFYYERPYEYCPQDFNEYIGRLKSNAREAAKKLKCRIKDLQFVIIPDYRGCYYESDLPTLWIHFRKKK